MDFLKITILVLSLSFGLVFAGTLKKKGDDDGGEVVIHATNYSQVPSVHYIVDAVECLTEAYAVYADDVHRAELYAELFQEKHPEAEWNVVVGYTALHISAEYYVEVSVTSGGKNKDKKEDKVTKDKEKGGSNYLIFSTNVTHPTTAAPETTPAPVTTPAPATTSAV